MEFGSFLYFFWPQDESGKVILYLAGCHFVIERFSGTISTGTDGKQMDVLIKLKYMGWETNIERKGYFPVNSRRFKENNDMAVAEAAYQWIREIMRKENISKILEITYNGEHDITELVERKLNGWDNDLPF